MPLLKKNLGHASALKSQGGGPLLKIKKMHSKMFKENYDFAIKTNDLDLYNV